MNNQMARYEQAIIAAEPKFNEIASAHNLVTYAKEAEFAMQAIPKNDYLMQIANENPVSLQNAVTNVAAIGLSLNPALKLAYLVPRGGEACLDISYQGLIKLATDTGSILWAKAELVYESDRFEYRGPAEKPLHEADVFASNRGEFRGAYCIAKTADGEYLVETMSAKDISEIKAKSKGSNRSDSPWQNFPGEMRKKAVIKRAYKTWPKSERTRMAEAIQIIDQHEGLDEQYMTQEKPAEEKTVQGEHSLLVNEEQVNQIDAFIKENNIPKDGFMRWLQSTVKVDAFSDVPADAFDRVMNRLKSAAEHYAKQGNAA